MGLLDSLFDANTYGGQGGGLLDFLRATQMQQQNYQPSAGFPDQQPSPLDNAQWPYGPNGGPSPLDTAQWPAGPVGAPSSQAGPIAVGDNYQMPRVGGAAQFASAPQNAPTDVSAQSRQPQMQQMQPRMAPLPQAPGLGDRLGASLQSFANSGGPLPAIANGITSLITGQRTDPTGVAERQQQQAQNLTLQALIQKGVDPVTAQAAISNPEMLKTLVAQTYGPQTLTALGNGYVADKSGKISRAYEPDDKIPAGFQKSAGGLAPIPGGPADPAYLRMKAMKEKDPNGVYTLGKGGELYKIGPGGQPVIVHKNQEGGGDEATIDDKSAKLLAERVLMGDTKALVGLGRGAQGAANILKIHKMASDIAEDKGLDASGVLGNVAKQAQLVSSARALGTKETHFGVAEKAMEESLPLAQAASDAVPRSDWMGLNKLIQMGQTQHSNPLLKRFLIATDTAAKDYARTINPTGALREGDIEYARKILSTADGPEAYTAALDQLRMEAGVMHRAIGRQKNELYGKKDDGAAEPPTGKTKTGISWGFVK